MDPQKLCSTYTKPVGFETISLLMRLPFLKGGGGDEGAWSGGDFGGEGISSYRGPAMGSGSWGARAGQKNREGDGVEGMSANRSKKPLCSMVPPRRVVGWSLKGAGWVAP